MKKVLLCIIIVVCALLVIFIGFNCINNLKYEDIETFKSPNGENTIEVRYGIMSLSPEIYWVKSPFTKVKVYDCAQVFNEYQKWDIEWIDENSFIFSLDSIDGEEHDIKCTVELK